MPRILEAIKFGTSGNQPRKPTRAEVYKQASLLLELESSPSIPTNAYDDAHTVSERLKEVQPHYQPALDEWEESGVSNLGPSDWRLLAEVTQRLGDLRKAEGFYKEACFASLSSAKDSTQRVELMLSYVYFLLQHDMDLERAEEMCTMLLDEIEPSILAHQEWTSAPALQGRGEYPFIEYSTGWTYISEYILEILEALSLVHNQRGCFDKSRTTLLIIDYLYGAIPLHTDISIRVVFSRALLAWGKSFMERSKFEFCRAWIMSATLMGNWHIQTLWILHSFAVALLSWGEHEKAASIASECYLGRHYRFGPAHPLTNATLKVLERCTLTSPQLEAIKIVRGTPNSMRLISTVYEHMEIWTIADLMSWIGDDHSHLADNILGALLESANLLPEQTGAFRYLSRTKIRLERSMAACKARLGAPEEAITRLEWLLQKENRANKTLKLFLRLDMVVILSENTSISSPFTIPQLSENVFFEAEAASHGATRMSSAMSKAVHMKLAKHGLTHFEYGTKTDDRASPFVTIEKIGHGGFADVESVEVKGAVYARKVMIVPKHKERLLKDLIENEVSVMKALDSHHHTVKVFCTYQEKRQFSIVLEPLATADLETYLYQPNADPLHLSPTIERWMRCLTNTLAYLHRQGIRHKDVKTKNILVKGDQVYFSDFGSSRAFTHDSATSTEGPAFGNTRMYSAPEVIAEQRRNELSDVFSLGCVFSEMVTVLCGLPLDTFKMFRYVSDPGSQNFRSHAFFATLDLVDTWFSPSSGRIPSWGTSMYDAFIKPMLAAEPAHRPAARQVSEDMKRYFQSQTFELETGCALCKSYAQDTLFEARSSEEEVPRVQGELTWMDRLRGMGYLVTDQIPSVVLRYDGLRSRQALQYLKPGRLVEFCVSRASKVPEAYDLTLVASSEEDGEGNRR